MLGRQPALVRSSPATQCCYAMLFILSPFLCSPPSMSTSSILSQPFCYVRSNTPFSLSFSNQIIFLLPHVINLSISLVTSCNLSLEPFSSCLSSLPSLSQVHCSGHASSLPTWHRTELLSARDPHDHGCLGAGLCCVLSSPLWLQHHR